MAQVELIAYPPTVVEIIAEGAAPVEVLGSSPTLVEVITEGTQGVRGLPGAGVEPFEQAFAASPSWTVNHNLARRPSTVRVLTPGGIEAQASVTDTSLNQLVISFASAQAGRVVIF